jgi:hypothetical protein
MGKVLESDGGKNIDRIDAYFDTWNDTTWPQIEIKSRKMKQKKGVTKDNNWLRMR